MTVDGSTSCGWDPPPSSFCHAYAPAPTSATTRPTAAPMMMKRLLLRVLGSATGGIWSVMRVLGWESLAGETEIVSNGHCAGQPYKQSGLTVCEFAIMLGR